MAFENILDQPRATALLRAALRTGFLAHAYLFVGPGGVGRTAVAREFASVLLCTEGREERCGACRSCRSFAGGNHPDYREVGIPDGRQDVPIDLIRSLQHEAAIKPVLARRRVFVVRDAQRMTPEAANCFLKTLEEPPGNACFILIATTLWDMPPTVESRCRVIRFSSLAPGPVEQMLRGDGLSDDGAWWLARRSWGSPGRATHLRAAGLHEFNRQLTDRLFGMGPQDNLSLSDWLCEAAPEGTASRAEARAALQELLECVAVFYRDLAVAAVAPGEAELFNRDLKDRIGQFASRLSLDAIIECADCALEAIDRVGANANNRLALDDLFSRLASECCCPEGQ